MAKWVTEHFEELLVQINEVPYTDDRDRRQLSILMNGFSKINNLAMEKAAIKTRSQLRGWSLDDALEEPAVEAPLKAAKKSKNDDAADELTRLRPIR